MQPDRQRGQIDEQARFIMAVGNALTLTKRLDGENVVRRKNAVEVCRDREHRVFC